MEQLGNCVQAMIQEAIEENELNEAASYLNQIAVYEDNLLSNFSDLSPEPSSILIDAITLAVDEIESLTNSIRFKFEGPDGYRHEKFTEALLDGLASEGTVRVAVIAALKCRGGDQATGEEYSSQYKFKIQNRLDMEFNEEDAFSIMYQLRNSEFYTTWPDTMSIVGSDSCHSGHQGTCDGSSYCDITDGYRYDLVVARGSGSCNACLGHCTGCQPAGCSDLLVAAENYARDTYSNMAANVTEAADLERRFIDYINEILSSSPSEDMCGGRPTFNDYP